jgi:hypothetical protein
LINEKRDRAAQKLQYILPNYLYSLEEDKSVEEADVAEIKKLKHVLRSDNKLPTDLL